MAHTLPCALVLAVCWLAGWLAVCWLAGRVLTHTTHGQPALVLRARRPAASGQRPAASRPGGQPALVLPASGQPALVLPASGQRPDARVAGPSG